jgi:glycogen operon protein
MHWESHEFGLPRLPKGMKWKLLLTTDEQKLSDTEAMEIISEENVCEVPARTVAIFISVQDVVKS